MSVIRFESKRIDDLCEAVLRAYKDRLFDHAFVSAIEGSERYGQVLGCDHVASRTRTNEERAADVVERLFWYLQCANRLAWALQYEVEPRLFSTNLTHSKQPTDSRAVLNTASDLRDELKCLAYNLVANDGNRFVDAVQYNLFRCLRHGLAEYLADKADSDA